MYYVNYNEHGQNIGHNSLAPCDIEVNGIAVRFDGVMSRKTFDIVNRENLVSHSINGTLYCNSESAARRVAKLLNENPNYKRNV